MNPNYSSPFQVSVKATRLVKGLLKMGRKDLAIIVLPIHRVELLEEEANEELEREKVEPKTSEEEEEDEGEEREDVVDVNAVSELARNVLGMQTRNDPVPVLPEVGATQGTV